MTQWNYNNQNNQNKNPLAKYYGTEANPTGLVLYVTRIAKARMDAYVRLVNAEVGWMGFIRLQERVDEATGMQLPAFMVLDDVFLYPQEVSSGSIESPKDVDLGEILESLPEGRDASQLRFFGHSHVNGQVYHSSIDIDMINDWAATGLEWFISHVQNKKGEVNVRFDQILPFRMSVPVTEVEVLEAEFQDEVENEILDRVTEKKWRSQHWTSKGSSKSDSKSDNSNSKGVEDNLPGKVISDDFKEQFDPENRLPKTMGTITRPCIRNKKFETRDGDRWVRQEIVQGIIIHESFENTPSARHRAKMMDHERTTFFEDFIKAYPPLDPTQGSTSKTSESRSIQRSDSKREGSETKQLPQSTSSGEGTEQESKSQTQTPSEAKSEQGRKQNGSTNERHTDSKRSEKNGNGEKSDKPESDERKHVLTEEEQQASLIVIEGGDDKEQKNEKDLEDEVNDALEQAGYVI